MIGPHRDRCEKCGGLLPFRIRILFRVSSDMSDEEYDLYYRDYEEIIDAIDLKIHFNLGE